MQLAFDHNLDERVASHVLDAFVRLVHEFEQFVDDRLQELPMAAQEARVLADDVHDVGSDHRLVVLAALLFAEAKQIFNLKCKIVLYLFSPLITVTKKRFSSSSCIAPLIEPIAQHN